MEDSSLINNLVKLTVNWGRESLLQLHQVFAEIATGMKTSSGNFVSLKISLIDKINREVKKIVSNNPHSIIERLIIYMQQLQQEETNLIPGAKPDNNFPLSILSMMTIISSSTQGGMSKFSKEIRQMLKSWFQLRFIATETADAKFNGNHVMHRIRSVVVKATHKSAKIKIIQNILFIHKSYAQDVGMKALECVNECILELENSELSNNLTEQFRDIMTEYKVVLNILSAESLKIKNIYSNCQHCKSLKFLKDRFDDKELGAKIDIAALELLQEHISALLQNGHLHTKEIVLEQKWDVKFLENYEANIFAKCMLTLVNCGLTLPYARVCVMNCELLEDEASELKKKTIIAQMKHMVAMLSAETAESLLIVDIGPLKCSQVKKKIYDWIVGGNTDGESNIDVILKNNPETMFSVTRKCCPSVRVRSCVATKTAPAPVFMSKAREFATAAAPASATLEKQKLIVFDTTLRDGEQSPGVTLTTEEKIEIAKQLSRLGVDVCEAGFPIASPGDFEAVQKIAKEVGPIIGNRKSGKPMRIAGLARAVQPDIARCFEAVKHAPLHRIHTFLATSDIHLKYKLKISRAECIQRAKAAVAFAKSIGCHDIEFSTEDAGRSDRVFLTEVLAEVIAAGATTLNIPDTVGYNVPEEYGAMIKYLAQNTEGADKVVWSTHCHNDLGLATANSLSGIVNGARQVECTINGIGERAGNTSLEEVIMTLHTHSKYYPVYHDIDTTQIYMTSQLVTKKSGMVIQPNKAIVGANAFAHESGIHQDGVLKHKETYEIIQPQTIGLPSNSLVLGKLSGRNAFRQRIDQILGTNSMYAEKLSANPQAFELLFASFKKLADVKKGGLNEQDLYALLDDQFNIQASGKETYRLKSVQVVSGNGVQSMATVSLVDLSRATFDEKDGTVVGGAVERMDAATGEGAVHAIFRSINRLTGMRNVLASYEVKAVTEGSDSLGRVVVRVHESSVAEDETLPKYADNLEYSESSKEVYQGTGTDGDVLIASAKAYINAINRLISTRQSIAAAEAEHKGHIVVDKVELKKEGAAAV
ncbi:hypothetical protein HK100_006307 [Physocladia obscura]|uniref:2-isopropylmalate synthase n=1 Tax=Physocladia obscura TaxID=109957 RepID=A0AAD5T6B0_9FUNG|nr:hypothetical protein HK100_006307 [Physocladia obscura]